MNTARYCIVDAATPIKQKTEIANEKAVANKYLQRLSILLAERTSLKRLFPSREPSLWGLHLYFD
jgi:hypothetical protein